MAETLYPFGYGTGLCTMAQLEARYGPKAPIPPHPEYWRRLKAWLISKEGKVGIGGAFRFTQPDKPGFAPPGKSFHEKQRFASGFEGYSAVDLVVRNGSNRHRAPYWSEVPRQGSGSLDIVAYGVHCNVNGEPWHMQCFEMDGYDGWVNRGRPDPTPNYGVVNPPPKPPPTGGEYELGERTLRVATPKMRGNDVQWVQQTLKNQGLTITVDGWYGGETRHRVMLMQGWNGLVRDGVVGPKTWAVLKKY